jgi:hypothetical protein
MRLTQGIAYEPLVARAVALARVVALVLCPRDRQVGAVLLHGRWG